MKAWGEEMEGRGRKYIADGTDFEFGEFNFTRVSFPYINLFFLYCSEIQKVEMNNNFSGIHGSDEIKALKEACQFETFI